MKIVFDIDGVVRDLMGIIKERYGCLRPVKNWVWHHKGKTIFDYVREDYSVLINAKPTKYCDIIQKYGNNNHIEFWSAQPDDWQVHTEKWIKKYFKNFSIKYFKHHEKFRTLCRKKDVVLVEDYPMFKDYSKIILIDWKYNRHVKNPIARISTVDQLRKIFHKYKSI